MDVCFPKQNNNKNLQPGAVPYHSRKVPYISGRKSKYNGKVTPDINGSSGRSSKTFSGAGRLAEEKSIEKFRCFHQRFSFAVRFLRGQLFVTFDLHSAISFAGSPGRTSDSSGLWQAAAIALLLRLPIKGVLQKAYRSELSRLPFTGALAHTHSI